MIVHKVKVFPSKIHLPKKNQLAWKIAEIASDNAKLNNDAIEMAINRIIDNASVAIASLNRSSVVSSREMALKHFRKNGATLFGINNKLKFDFQNSGSKHVRITKIYVSDSDGDRILEFKPKTYSFNGPTRGMFVSPYKNNATISSNFDAYRFGKTAGWKCSYQKPYEKSIGDKTDNALGVVSDFFSDLFVCWYIS